MIFFFKLLVLFSSLSSDERYSTSNSWSHGSFCGRVSRPFLKRGSEVGESGLFDFLGGQRQDCDPLSLAKSLQQKLAAVFETHRVAIRVHLGGDFDELHLLHFPDSQFLLQALGDVFEKESCSWRHAHGRSAFIGLPLRTVR
jgi:hypothetical protein